MNYKNEVWKDIKGYEGLYQVSNFGRVFSIRKNKIIYQQILKTGYAIVTLYDNKKATKKTVHRLVAKAFIPNPKNKLQVNHIDNNRKNNKVENLEWCTNRENQMHCIKQGRAKDRYKRAREVSSKEIIQYNLNGKYIKTWESILSASKTLKIDNSAISKCCRGKRNKCGNYIWKYKEAINNGI